MESVNVWVLIDEQVKRRQEEREKPYGGWPNPYWAVRVGAVRFRVSESDLLAYDPPRGKFLYRTPTGRHFYVYTFPCPMIQPTTTGMAYLFWNRMLAEGEVTADFHMGPRHPEPEIETAPIPVYCPDCSRVGPYDLSEARQYPWCRRER